MGLASVWLYDSMSNFRDWNFLDCMQVIFASLADMFVNRVTFQFLHDWPCNMARKHKARGRGDFLRVEHGELLDGIATQLTEYNGLCASAVASNCSDEMWRMLHITPYYWSRGLHPVGPPQRFN